MATDKNKDKDKSGSKGKAKPKAKTQGKSKPKSKAKDQDRYTQDPDPGKVYDLSGVYQPHDPPTFEKVWLMFQASDKKWQETERFLKEKTLDTDKRLKEFERWMQELSREMDNKWQKTELLIKENSFDSDNEWQETKRLVRSLSQDIGDSVGEVAKAYFHGAFSNFGELSGIKVKAVDSMRRTVGKVSGQFDIVVFGDKANILVEVKHKLREQDVIRFSEKTFPAFKRLYPEHCKVKLFGAVAGMTAKKDAVKLAIEKGLLVFTQSGQKLWLRNPEGFEPKEF